MSKTRAALTTEVFRPREWGTPTKSRPLPRPWFGLDTERDAKTGQFVCGYAVGETTHRFQYLTELPAGVYWVWGLPYDIEGMMRDMAEENGWAMKSDGAPFTIGDATCIYYHGKRFEWKDHRGLRIFLEASSFFGRASLQKAAKSLLGDSKDPGVVAKYMSAKRYFSPLFKLYRARVDRYCRKDARLVYRIVKALETGVIKAGAEMGAHTDLGATPGATARKFVNSLGQFPRILWASQSSFLRAYCGGRFEITKRGLIEDVYQYDIVSAYPWALAQCPFLTANAKGRFTRRYNDHALYGCYEVSFRTDEYLGLAPQWLGSTRVYSRGEEKTWLSRPEVAWLQNHGYDFTIIQGMEVWDENATNQWGVCIEKLFDLKDNHKGKPEGMGAKIILNSMYGILIQLVPRSGAWVPILEAKNPVDFAGDLALEMGPLNFTGGKYYAPLYASHLTALTRIKLLDAARACRDGYIGGHTDSVLTTKPIPESKGLGGWEIVKTETGKTKADELIITKTGMYAMDEKVKSRGIARDVHKSQLWQPWQTRNVRVGVKTATSWDQVSVIHSKQVANNLEFETKRKWHGDFSAATIKARKVIDSEALCNVGVAA